MNIRSWLVDSYIQISDDGLNGVKKSCRPVKNNLLSIGNLFHPEGQSIYDSDWDLLIILDACRYDLLAQLSQEYRWINSVKQVRSLDSTTAFWMRKTFTKQRNDLMRDTAYICGNPFSKSELNPQDFGKLIELWQTAWADPGTVPPEAVTDETIRLMRNESYDRVIAHYMQPHCPFIPKPELSKGKNLGKFGNQEWRDVWERLRDDDLTVEEVWNGYSENLRIALDEVSTLINNINAEKVIITSDHGNAIGEWGVYGHPPNLPLKNLRMVPWIETSASNTGNYVPEEWLESEHAVALEDQLSSLGYVD